MKQAGFDLRFMTSDEKIHLYEQPQKYIMSNKKKTKRP